MRPDQARLALTEAMSMHDARVKEAAANTQRAKATLDQAEAELQAARRAREAFRRYFVTDADAPANSG